MKLTVGGVPVECTPAEAIELLAGLQKTGKPAPGKDPAILTPKQREAYEVLSRHSDGAHYKVVAEELGLDENATCSRLSSLVINAPKLVQRTGSGIYQVIA